MTSVSDLLFDSLDVSVHNELFEPLHDRFSDEVYEETLDESADSIIAYTNRSETIPTERELIDYITPQIFNSLFNKIHTQLLQAVSFPLFLAVVKGLFSALFEKVDPNVQVPDCFRDFDALFTTTYGESFDKAFKPLYLRLRKSVSDSLFGTIFDSIFETIIESVTRLIRRLINSLQRDDSDSEVLINIRQDESDGEITLPEEDSDSERTLPR